MANKFLPPLSFNEFENCSDSLVFLSSSDVCDGTCVSKSGLKLLQESGERGEIGIY